VSAAPSFVRRLRSRYRDCRLHVRRWGGWPAGRAPAIVVVDERHGGEVDFVLDLFSGAGGPVERVRALADEDVAHIARRVERGGTFVIGSEEHGGGFGRVKAVVRSLTPLAQVWVAAIAFDPFRRGRLHVLLNLQPAAGGDLGDVVRAARPLTAGGLLAVWLTARQAEPFTAEDAGLHLAALRESAPPGAFIDPLAAEPEAAGHAIERMLRLDGIAPIDGRYQRVGEARDPRLPAAEGTIAAQARLALETIDALKRVGPR
jgi:hypothetical protein